MDLFKHRFFFFLIFLGIFCVQVSFAFDGHGGYTTYPNSNGEARDESNPKNAIESTHDPNSSDYWGIVPDPFPANTFPYVSLYPQNATTSYGTVAANTTLILNASSTNVNTTVYYFTLNLTQALGVGFGATLACGGANLFQVVVQQQVYSIGPLVARCPAGQNLQIVNTSLDALSYLVVWNSPWYDQSTSSVPVSLNNDNANFMSSSTDQYAAVALNLFSSLIDFIIILILIWFIVWISKS